MHETYRMLGREHEADLEREAARRALGALLPARPPLTKRAAASLCRVVLRRRVQPVRPHRPDVVPSREPAAR
jgi:hypothetical protein